MRKKANKLLALLTAVAITVTGVNVPTNTASAASAKLSAKKVTLTVGKKKTIYLKKGNKKLAIKSVKSSKKKVATVKKKGKKIIITAKKKGTATITVKAKVNKKVKSFKCKVKVKKATPTATPSAAPSAAPSLAPSAEPSAVPSDAPSAAPSDDASAAPSADVSASPSADASAEPSAEPSKEPSKVTEIKLLNDTALTNADADKAYVYYDVLDQYGESMRESVDIQWTTSPAGGKADKISGRITVTNTDGFKYGDKIFVTGVHVKTGIVMNESVTVGMTQNVDTVKFEGFVNKNDTTITKPLENLPANFATNTYYMLFTTYDQNGNPLDVTEEGFASKNLTFISNNPLLLTLEDTSTEKNFTIGGIDYAAVRVEPGQYVDKGGEALITAVSNKTGGKKEFSVLVGERPQLKSLELSVPTAAVADGDSNVEIPYVAKDMNGNSVTDFETIVRSSNSLSLNCSEGTLVVKEKNDGSAGIYWSDIEAYNPKKAGTYAPTKDGGKMSDITNGIDRNISLTTIVVGGDSSNLLLPVSDMRIPTTIKSVTLPDYLANKSPRTFALNVNGWQDGYNNIVFLDQYGAELNNDKANAFFTNASENKFGSSTTDSGIYGLKITKAEHLGLANDTILQLKYGKTGKKNDDGSDKYGYLTVNGNKNEVGFVANSNILTSDTLKFSIVKYVDEKGKSMSNTDDWTAASKAVTKTINIIPLTKIGNLSISGLDQTIVVATGSGAEARPTTTSVDDAKKAAFNGLTAVDEKDDTQFEVVGTYNGNKIEIPRRAIAGSSVNDWRWNIVQDDESKVATKEDGINLNYHCVDGSGYYINAGYAIDGEVTEADAFDFSRIDFPGKVFSKELVLRVNNENNTSEYVAWADADEALKGAEKTLATAVKALDDDAKKDAVASGAAIAAKKAYDALEDYTDATEVAKVKAAYEAVKNAKATFAAQVTEVTSAIDDVVTKTGTYNTRKTALEKAGGSITDSAYTLVRKDVSYCAAPSSVTSLEFAAYGNVPANPTNTVLSASDVLAGADYNTWQDMPAYLKILSQYGREMKGDIVYTITDYTEDEVLGKKKGNAQVIGNGTANFSIEGAEIGDTFTLTAKQKGTNITASVKITVGADKKAFIGANSGDDEADKTLRKTYFDYVK